MSQAETVRQDTRSYRQGLVLGLTMAEVFLLLVFALLIALAALWNNEHQRRVAAEIKAGQVTALDTAERNLLVAAEDAAAVAGRGKTTRLLTDFRANRNPQTLTPEEHKFVEEVRRQQAGATSQTISDQWRRLTEATSSLPE